MRASRYAGVSGGAGRSGFRSTPSVAFTHIKPAFCNCAASLRVKSSSADFGRSAEEFQRAASRKAEELKNSAQQFVSSASGKMSDFISEQQLDGKAKKATRDATNRLQDMYAEMQDNARRTYWRLDSEYRINEKTRKAYRRAQQAVADVDSQYSVRSKLRTAGEDFQRNWPRWRQQFQEFSKTTPGMLVLALAFGVLLSTGVIWRILNIFLVLWWLSVPLSVLTINMAQRQQQEAFRQAAEAQDKQQPRWGGFGNMGGFAGGFNNAGRQNRQSGSKWGQQPGGPIIDAEFTTINEKRG